MIIQKRSVEAKGSVQTCFLLSALITEFSFRVLFSTLLVHDECVDDHTGPF